MREQLSYFRALGAGALILEGMFADRLSPFHLTPTAELSTRVAHVQHLLTESARMGEERMGKQRFRRSLCMTWTDFAPAGLKVVLDICDANVTGNADESSNRSTSVPLKRVSQHYWLVCFFSSMQLCVPQDALLFWLERGAAGFAICDTDAAYSEKVN